MAYEIEGLRKFRVKCMVKRLRVRDRHHFYTFDSVRIISYVILLSKMINLVSNGFRKLL